MIVLVDSSVWSAALRRTARESSATAAVRGELAELIREQRVAIIGPVRQELLSGIRAPEQFDLLRTPLEAFRDLPLDERDHELAAQMFNRCRASGVQGSNTDFLICAVAKRRRLAIFTTDRDFERFAGLLDLRLHASRG